jgi:capsular polysaccharide biosynthesis protein
MRGAPVVRRFRRLKRGLRRWSMRRESRPQTRPGANRRLRQPTNTGREPRFDSTLVVLADDATNGESLRRRIGGAAGTSYVISAQEDPEWNLAEFEAQHRPAASLGSAVAAMISIGPLDHIVDLRAVDESDRLDAWKHSIWLLRRGGTYTTLRQDRAPSKLASFLSRLLATDGPKHEELRRAVRSFTVSRREVIVTKRNTHFLKLRELNASRVLQSRATPTTVRDVVSFAAGRFESHAELHCHASSVPIGNLPTTIDYPPVKLRHYQGPIHVVGNCLVHTESEILPESFPRSFTRDLHAVRTRRASFHFAEIRDGNRPRRHLEGTFYHVDSVNPGHFGHLMADVVGRLWGWPEAKKQIPDLRAIFRIRFPNERDPALERLVFTAAGIPEQDIVWVDEPVRVDSLVGASPMFHNTIPYFSHPRLVEVWDRITAALIDSNVQEAPEKIFVSRRPGRKNRNCRNTEEVERLFRKHGWHIVYPEDHPLSYQATVFSRARQVAGFGGSGLFNVMHVRQLDRLIVLNHEGYTARNEHLYAALKGGEEHYFWSTPEIRHPQGRWSEAAYFSAWNFDFDRNLAELEPLLS